MSQVFVKSEFAPLKRVVLARSEFAFPSDDDFGEDEFLTEETRELYMGKDVQGKNYKEVFPERQEKWENERENLKKVLEKYGVDVLHPRLLTDYEKEMGKEDGYSNFFVRDPFFTVGPFLIEGSLRFRHRRNEIQPVRKLLASESNEHDCLYVSIPTPDLSAGPDSEDGPFLEGGDVLVLGKTIFVGRSGLASNVNGVHWLKNLVRNYGYEVVEVPLHETILHLDCAISLVREGLMIVCEDALLQGIPKQLEDWDKIYVSLDDASRLATNGLPINEEVYITDPAFKFIGAQLEERGIRVEYVDFEISRSFGGSFRCSTQPLLRNS
ncbi:dimethylarginine dimethylaminohydrolase family protein [Edaphobacillus lindanitolerans]|uniref:N-Dimethylarginine dimethylaminohydrolase n=1 Tax=Edaphobacillus lindanitolerans TaxID=550447 RepID=A0A1U7PPM4_9BACI|nr:arginine deiminase-related protein [Edaphobacillus lindanitolerans]SIT90962.1 N-Dimethylarginine dimethylaminohydrolase [Edaphobacillus lindanitolerans]